MKTLTRDLFLAIEPAEIARDEAIAISDAICELSRHYTATATLLAEYRKLILAAESHWREIEQRPDYHYKSREDTRADYLRYYYQEEEKTCLKN